MLAGARWLLLFVGVCAAASTACTPAPVDGSKSSVSNLDEGEEELEVLDENLPSKTDVVDHWKAAVVSSPKYGKIIVFTSYPGRSQTNPTYELVVPSRGAKPIFRMSDPGEAFDATDKQMRLLAADFKALSKSLNTTSRSSSSDRWSDGRADSDSTSGSLDCWRNQAAGIADLVGNLFGAVTGVFKCVRGSGLTFGQKLACGRDGLGRVAEGVQSGARSASTFGGTCGDLTGDAFGDVADGARDPSEETDGYPDDGDLEEEGDPGDGI